MTGHDIPPIGYMLIGVAMAPLALDAIRWIAGVCERWFKE